MTSSNAVPVLRVRVFSVADQDQWDLLRSDITTTCTVFTDIITTDDPGLKRDYVPKAGSPCVNHGLNQAWMDTALDLVGNPRILGEAVDIGAFERRD